MLPAFSRRMPFPRASSHSLVIALVIGLLGWSQFTGSRWLERIELPVQDALAQQGRPAPRDPALVFLARDTASANLETGADLERFDLRDAGADARRALELMAHEWPWSREVHALVLDRLVKAGARAVIFDFTFPKPTPADDLFRAKLDEHRERVAVAGNIAEDNALGVESTVPVFGAPTPTLLPPATPRDPRIGFDNFWADGDGIIRRAQYRWAVTHGIWQSPEELSLGARALHRAGLAAAIPGGLAARRMRFAGPGGTFPPRSIYEIFVPEYWRRNFAGGEFFREKIVVIGASGNWQQDEHLSPLGMMPGPELHLNAINAAMHRAFLHEMPPLPGALVVIAAGCAAAMLRRWMQRPHLRFLAQLALSAGWGGLAFLLYDHADLFLPCTGPLLAFNLASLSGLAFDILTERREKARLRRTLERYVSRNVVEEMVDNPDRIHRALGGELRDVTVLFSDIRGFTMKAREMESRELVAQLNEYFSAMVACVFRFGGTLDKFIGDAVMAVWGNTGSAGPAADARHAVACALAMFDELAALNRRWAAEGRPQFRIGIGINSGPVVVGNIGSPQRMEFTVIGDAVNVAWRLQEKTKGEHTLLLGEAVLPLLGDDFPTEIVGEIRPAGDSPVAVARLVREGCEALATS